MDKNINIKMFLEEFKKEYNYLYENHDMVAGYREALQAGECFIKNHPAFVSEFCKFRGDLLTSDREVAAFGFAMENALS